MGNILELPMRPGQQHESVLERVIATRPLPPRDMWKAWESGDLAMGDDGDVSSPRLFRPDNELEAWIREVFIEGDGPIVNPDHWHLDSATIGCLWTCVPMNQKMRDVAATAEMPRAQGNKWQKSRADFQLMQWFGDVPNFLLTFYAPYCVEVEDDVFCAIAEHELYHCGQARDAFDQPRFSEKTGAPVFGIRDHDVTEFVGVTKRWGLHVSANVEAMVEAALAGPTIKAVDVRAVCGRCMAKAA